MFNKIFLIYLLVLISFNPNIAKSEKTFENMFVRRCDNKLSQEKSDQYDKCDSEASDTIKETVKYCAKENCNKDGKFDKSDVCCYAIKPNAMFACFEKTINEFETKEAKNRGVNVEEVHRKNLHNSAKIVECYEEIDD